MKIGNPADKTGSVQVGTTRSSESVTGKSGPGKTVGSSVAGGEASAKVELSSTAAALLAGGSVEFDAGKVERIGRAIAEGKYQVNAEVIADKLIANAEELLARAQKR